MSGDVVLAVDVGNSKTHVAVADGDGRLLRLDTAPGASPQALGVAGSWAVIEPLARDAIPPGRRLAAVALAVAGLDFPEHETQFAAARPDWLTDASMWVGNDTFAVLRQHTAGAGIAVVVGAGMNAVAVAGERVVRFPALGALSGDWGGGLMIAEAAIGAACRAADGRGPDTRLHDAVPAHFGRRNLDEVLRAVVAGEVTLARRAALARVVLTLADDGDAVCVALMHRQAEEVLALVRAARNRLLAAGEGPLAFGGGILTAGCATLDAALDEQVSARRSAEPPVHGVVRLALDLLDGR